MRIQTSLSLADYKIANLLPSETMQPKFLFDINGSKIENKSHKKSLNNSKKGKKNDHYKFSVIMWIINNEENNQKPLYFRRQILPFYFQISI